MIKATIQQAVHHVFSYKRPKKATFEFKWIIEIEENFDGSFYQEMLDISIMEGYHYAQLPKTGSEQDIELKRFTIEETDQVEDEETQLRKALELSLEEAKRNEPVTLASLPNKVKEKLSQIKQSVKDRFDDPTKSMTNLS